MIYSPPIQQSDWSEFTTMVQVSDRDLQDFHRDLQDFVAKGHEKDAYGNKNYGDKCTKFEFMNNGWPYNIIAEAIAFGKKNALRTKKSTEVQNL